MSDTDTWVEKYVRYFAHTKNRDVYESLLCGATAGIVAKTVIAPGDRIKMSFQVSSEKFTLYNAFSKGREIVATRGVFSLWRGHSTTILRIAPYAGLSYAIHDFSENAFKKMLNRDILPPQYKFLAGSLAGVGGTVLTYPLDVLRVRLAIGRTWAMSLKQGGLYQGLGPTLIGIVPYSGTAWLSKQTMMEYFPTVMHRKPTVAESVVINAIAGLLGQFITYPLDVVRRRMQVARANPDGKVPNLREVWRELIASEGPKGAAKGFSMNVIKGPIAFSASITTYDLLRNFFNTQHQKYENQNNNGGNYSGNNGSNGSNSGNNMQKRKIPVMDATETPTIHVSKNK